MNQNQVQVVDPVLSNISIQYRPVGLVADRIFPRQPVGEVSGTCYKYEKGMMFDIVDTRREINSGYKRASYKMETDTYKCFENGLEEVIDDRLRKIAGNKLNLEIDTTEFVTQLVALAAEKRVVDIVTNSSLITQYTTLTSAAKTQFNDYTNSDPIGVIQTGKATINAAIGRDPNKLVLGKEVFDKLVNHPALLDRIKYSQTGIVTAALMAVVFGVDEVLVAESLYNTVKKNQTASLSRLWGKKALLCYSEPTPGLKKISLGYTYEFSPRQTMAPFRDENNIGDVIRVKEDIDEKLMSADCGYLIVDAVA
jgi:hypothetical protein